MPRHHNHNIKSKNKQSLIDLQNLQETHDAAEAIKADLLAHNNVIAIHNETDTSNMIDEQADQVRTVMDNSYIKSADEMQRIAENTARLSAAAMPKTLSQNALSTNIGQLFEIQQQCFNLMMQGWMGIFSIASTVALGAVPQQKL